MLKVAGIMKRFGGITAVQDISMEVRQGEVLGLIGPNGAGKTTFFNILTGIYKPDGGTITFAGKQIDGQKPYRIARSGMVRTFQNIRLLKDESVLENVMVGMLGSTRSGLWSAILGLSLSKLEEKLVIGRSLQAIELVGLMGREHELAGGLSYGNQRRVEIARALVSNPKLLLLDEPTAGMNAEEVKEIEDLVRKIRMNGTTIILIEHNVGMVVGLCDRIVVLDHGEKIADGRPEEIISNPKVIEAYIGKEEVEVNLVAENS